MADGVVPVDGFTVNQVVFVKAEKLTGPPVLVMFRVCWVFDPPADAEKIIVDLSTVTVCADRALHPPAMSRAGIKVIWARFRMNVEPPIGRQSGREERLEDSGRARSIPIPTGYETF
jgi:hypothetical protein